ncbi:MAG TPA: hypothetical protein VFE34_17550 [Dongiaceae bacterium]|jgi:hypothetical protein|nr:hypothetical protein [Dongiaceae bacterium]
MLKRLENRLREIKPAEFRRMESAATKVTFDLLGAFHDNFKGTLRAIDGLMVHPDYWNAMWRRQLYRLAHDLRGLGGTFNYELITTVGGSLCSLINNDDLPNDRRLQRHITAHVAALKAILQFDLKGDGGNQGEELLATLRIEKTKL